MEMIKQERTDADRDQEDVTHEELQVLFGGECKSALQQYGPMYIHPDQTAKLMLIKCTHREYKGDQLVYWMEDCIPLKCMVSDPCAETERLETRECCFECFSAHEACNPHGPGNDGCEVRSKSYFKAAAKHWRWCKLERIDPRSADIPRRWPTCG